MTDIGRTLIREPGAGEPGQYARRVFTLAAAYVGLFGGAVAGVALLIWKAQLYVTLSQRSNVETLVLAFLLVFFGYVAILSARGVPGAARIASYELLARATGDRAAVERRKMEVLGPPRTSWPVVMLNVILEREGRPGEPFEIAVADGAGSMGPVRVDGARLTHVPAHRGGSNDLLAFVAVQVAEIVRRRGVEREVDVVAWKKIDDEATEQYYGLVEFARNLQRHLGAGDLWPKVVLTDADCHELERRLAAICPALRNEAFLPDWEYQAEHKVPIVPEPLGLVSLARTERRVDPVTSMGCAVLVVLAVVAILALFIVAPPWVPGA